MIEDAIQLADGQALQKRRGSWILQPEGLTVDVQVEGDVATITEPDTGKVSRRRMAGGDRGQRPRQRPQATAGRPRPASDRWATLNEFTDETLRTLTASEARVWFVLFRDVRGGVARAGMTDIAKRAGLTRRGVVKAIAGLKRRQLVEVAIRGSVNGTPNAYRIVSRPA